MNGIRVCKQLCTHQNNIMHGLTMYYPWCYLWLMDIKKYETRPRSVRCQLPSQLIIHCAAKKPDSTEQKLADKYLGVGFKPAFGHAIGVCTLTSTICMTEAFISQQSPQEIELGFWELGRVAWEATNKTLFNVPIKIRGYQAAPWNATSEITQLVHNELNINTIGDNLKTVLSRDKNLYVIKWKDIPIGTYTPSIENVHVIDELHFRCQHIESLGLIPSLRNCNVYWKDYQNLETNTVESAFPWVIDDFLNGQEQWRKIDKHHYDWYVADSNNVNKHTSLCGVVFAYDVYLVCQQENGKYYAKLTRLTNKNNE